MVARTFTFPVVAVDTSLPSWVPSAGTWKNIFNGTTLQNSTYATMRTVDPERSSSISVPVRNLPGQGPQPYGVGGLQNVLSNYSGGAYAPDYSQYGAMCFRGGGHFNYYGSQMALFDFTTRTWQEINQPLIIPGATSWTDYTGSTNMNSSAGLYEYEADYGDYKLDNATPGTAHHYATPTYLPPSMGGGTKGSVLVRTTNHTNWHRCDLATGAWSRFGGLSPYYWANAFYGFAALDTTRKILWAEGGSGGGSTRYKSNGATTWGQAEYFDLNDMTWKLSGKDWSTLGSYFNYVMVYWQQQDALVALCSWPGPQDGTYRRLAVKSLAPAINQQGWTLNVPMYSTEKGALLASNSAESAYWPTSNAAGLDYCVADGNFYSYEGFGKTYVWKITPPTSGSITTGQWTVTKVQMASADGSTPSYSGRGDAECHSKWRYIPPLKSFAWCDNVDGPMQLWRPPGVN